MLDITVLIVVFTAYILLCGIVYANNPQAKLNRILSLLLLATPLWCIVVFLEDVIIDPQLINLFVRLDYFLASCLIGLFYWFCEVLSKRSVNVINKIVMSLTILSSLMALLGLMANIVKDGDRLVLHPIPLSFTVFIILLLVSLLASIWNIGLAYHHAQGKQRAQIAYVGIGLLITIGVVFTALVIMPRLLEASDTYVTRIGLYGTLFFAVFSVYAIVKYNFLDIRQAIARGTAYMMVLLVLTVVYVALVFGFVELFLGKNEIQSSEMLVYTVVAVGVAFLYNTLTKFFNRITDKIFYRRDYDLQEVLAKVGDITSGGISIKVLGNEIVGLLNQVFKPNFVVLYIPEVKDRTREFVANSGQKIENGDLSSAMKVIGEQRILLLGENDYPEVMNRRDVNVIIPLRSSKDIVGIILLGPKNVGSMYDVKDQRLLLTISDELSLAVQNSLRFQQIEKLNETLQDRINEATSKLRTTNRQLREIDASKDEFLSMASHQLRTPLTSIKGYISMLLEGDLGKLTAAQRSALEEAYGSSQRMVYLISDFLNLSRLQTGRFELEKTEVNLTNLIKEEISQLKDTARSRNITLLYDEPRNFPSVLADETKIRQVMMNFIDNAVYYSKPNGGEILVALDHHRDSIIFSVKDNGIGVPHRMRDKLFTKFYRADNAKKARPDGTGIGLYMAKKVILAHGGTIIFESKEGVGSEFGFRLPKIIPGKT